MKKTLLSFVILLISLTTFSQTINTLAGGGVADGPAASATFFGPFGVALDASGNVFVADFRNNRVRKIATNGIVSTIAGTGNRGFSGDGGPAVNAMLHGPRSLQVDGAGNVLVLEEGNARIRKIDVATGVISTIAGGGASLADGVPAVNANLQDPRAICIDASGNIFIAQGGNARVRKIDSSGIISTYAGTGVAGFSGDNGPATSAKLSYNVNAVAVDPAGNLYIGDYMRIRKVTPAGVITTICNSAGNLGFTGDNGPAISARLTIVYNLSTDASGNLYLSDYNNNRIRKINTGGIITTVAGGGGGGDNGPATSAWLALPGCAVPNAAGELYISEVNGYKIRKVSNAGIITTYAGTGTVTTFSGDNGPATAASLYSPDNSVMDVTGNTYFVDAGNYRVRKVDLNGAITTFAGGGVNPPNNVLATSAAIAPTGVAVDLAGDILISESAWISKVNTSTGIITKIAGGSTLGFSGDGGPALSATFSGISDLVVDQSGNIFLSDQGNGRIRKIDTNGIVTTIAGTGGYNCSNAGPATSAQFRIPSGIAVDPAGNVYVSDRACNMITKIDTNGTLTRVAGMGLGFSGDGGPATFASFRFPEDVAVDSTGALYVADTENHRIRKISTSGIITTIAGSGSPMFTGDGVPATQSGLNYPRAVFVNNANTLLISDSENHRVRKTLAGISGMGPLADHSMAQSSDLSPADSKKKITVSPNPANHSVSIQVPHHVSGDTPIIIYDAYGVTYYAGDLKKGESQAVISTQHIAAGIYTVAISTGQAQRHTVKLLIAH